ncbi:inositol-triphosphate type 1 protein (macronuclear) [Tetrahymena thermophila SB210]|uniref:Inositol-triphosphate type 1 protein n=1 Tax=Tetrahymena thermophila (strain SB210) TaxID=312017 RepID=W7XAT4_TETTS|nr:inositol-triphosphate type 1 protein [Tetrahymena thermophila SB210]EWS73528.1 inositol-triphosphate type 1 protein [Tetrahymena thermophila SB210]|eukprot:XP_012653918.1 inositol-triphosphate type 1 protein [Tetrahymena thermophila SB210]
MRTQQEKQYSPLYNQTQVDQSNIDLLNRDSQQIPPKLPLNLIVSARQSQFLLKGLNQSQINRSQRIITPNMNAEIKTQATDEQNNYQQQQQINQQNQGNLFIPRYNSQTYIDNTTNSKQGYQQIKLPDLVNFMGYDRKKEMHINLNQKDPLLFGSIISLNPFEEPMKFIMSDGFVKNQAYIKDLSFDGSGSVFDRCLFKVYPSFKSKYLRELLEKSKDFEKTKRNTTNPIFRKQTTESKFYTSKKEKSEQQKQQDFEANVMQEYKHNMDVFEKLKGTPVSYNQELQLLHVASNTFLTCNFIQSEIENQNFGLELQQFSSKSTIFKIQPCYTHQQRTEGIVLLKDVVYITSAASYLGRQPYLHSSKVQEQLKDNDLDNKQGKYNKSQNDFLNERPKINQLGTGNSFTTTNNDQKNKVNLQQQNNFTLQKNNTLTVPSQIEIYEDKNHDENLKSYQELYQNQSQQKSQNIGFEQSSDQNQEQTQTINSINDDHQLISNIFMQTQLQKQYSKRNTLGAKDNTQTNQQGNYRGLSKIQRSFIENTGEKQQQDRRTTQMIQKENQLQQQNTLKTGNDAQPTNTTIQQKEKDIICFADKNSSNQEANASLEQKTKWRIILYANTCGQQDFLQYGDVIWLNHVETGFTIISKKSENTYNNYNYVTVDSSSKKDQSSKYEGNTNGMWIIENENFTQGGLMTWEDRFFLRNFSSGKYLSLNPCMSNLEQATFKVSEFPDVLSLFMFTPISTADRQKDMIYIAKDSFFFIKSIYLKGWIHIRQKQEESALTNTGQYQNQFIKGSLLLKIKYQQPLDDDAFKVIRATMTEVLEANFLISCFPILRQSLFKLQKVKGKEVQVLQNSQEYADLQRNLSLLKSCLEDLDKFCKNQIITTSLDYESSNYGKLNYSRQKVLYEQYYIDIVIQLLKELLSKSELENLKKIRITDIKVKIADKIKNCLVKQNNSINLQLLEDQLIKKHQKSSPKRVLSKQDSEALYNAVSGAQDRHRKFHINYIKFKLSIVKVAYQLLTSICKQNPQNERYLFDKKIKDIKYQAKFLKEAIDSIIQIIGNNEKIINDLCDDIRIAERKRRNNDNQKGLLFGNQIKNQMFFNDAISNQLSVGIGRNSEQLASPLTIKQNENAQSVEETLKLDNILVFFVNLARDSLDKRNPNILKFFRTICSYKRKGVSVNQEIMYKFLDNIPGFEQQLLIEMKLDELQQMVIKFSDQRQVILDEKLLGKDQDVEINSKLQYLIQQIEFFSDLCLGRNYLWSNKMMSIFPFDYITKQIQENSLHEQARSAFCNLALSLYIDQEPLNEISRPQMCRIYSNYKQKEVEQMPSIYSTTDLVNFQSANNENSFEAKRESFSKLLTFSIEYLQNEIKQIITKYDEIQSKLNQLNPDNQNSSRIRGIMNWSNKYTAPLDNNVEQYQMENRLSSALTFNIVKMLVTMIKLNVLTILQKSDQYTLIISNLVKLFEYDYQNYNITLSLSKKREERYEKQMNIIQENKLIAGIKGIQKKLKEAAAEVVEKTTKYTQKTFKYVGKFMGITYKKRKIIEEEILQFNENFFSSNPLVGGLVSLMQMIKQGDEDQNKDVKKLQIEISTKLEICEILLFCQSHRMDFLIANFLGWFDKLGKSDKFKNITDYQQYQKTLEQVIQEDLSTVIPNVCKTGIEFLDLLYKPLEKKNIINKQLEKMWKGQLLIEQQKRNKPKKFEVYTDQSEIYIPDLDTLITGKKDSIISSEILPSLLTTFYLTGDSVLEDKILEVIFNQSTQTEKLFQYLQNLEILFQRQDILPFKFLQVQIHKLRFLTERSEIWLNNYFQQTQIGGNEIKELNEIIKILHNIDSLFFSSTRANENGTLIISRFFREYQTQLSKQTNPYFIEQIQQECNQELDRTRQKIFTFLQGHNPIIQMIKNSQNQMVKFVKQQDVSADSKIKIVQLLRYLYSILVHFCYNIEDNQKILAKPEYLSLFFDEISIDFGQFDLLNAIYFNNKPLCSSFPDSLLNQIKTAINQFGRQPRFIQILKIIQSYKSQDQSVTLHLIENQIRVFRWFIPSEFLEKDEVSEYSYLLYGQLDENQSLNFDLSLHNNQIDDEVDQFLLNQGDKKEDDLKNSSEFHYNKKNFMLDAPFYYHAMLLDIFIHSIDGDEGYNLNINKIKKMFSLQYIFKFLLKEDDFLSQSPINIPHMFQDQQQLNPLFQDQHLQERSLYDKSVLYLVKTQEEGFSLIKPKALILIRKAYLNPSSPHLESLLRELNNIIYFIRIEINRFRQAPLDKEDFLIERYLEYFCEGFIEFSSAYLKAIAKNGDELEDIKEREDILLFHEMVQTLVARRVFVHQRCTSYQLALIMDFIKNCYKVIGEQDFLTQFKNIDSQVIPSPAKRKICNKDENAYYEGSLKLDFVDSSLQWISSQNWSIFLGICCNSSILHEQKENELSSLAQALINVENLYDRKIVFKDFLKKLISFVKNGIVNQVQIKNIKNILRLFEKILELQDNNQKLVEMQNIFDQLDAAIMVLTLISDIKENPFEDDKVLLNLFNFMNKLLQGGNKKVQKTIYNFFINHPKSEIIFQTFYTILLEQIEKLKEINKQEQESSQAAKLLLEKQIENQNKRKKNKSMSQPSSPGLNQKKRNKLKNGDESPQFNFESPPDKILENQELKLETNQEEKIENSSQDIYKQDLLISLLNLLQLFCEGHYLPLQNYLRFQSQNRNSYDIITITVELLDQLKLKKSNFKNMIICFDLLTKFVQGPCHENQEKIIDSKFLEIAYQILNTEISNKNSKQGLHNDQEQNQTTNNFKSQLFHKDESHRNKKNQNSLVVLSRKETVQVDNYQSQYLINQLQAKTITNFDRLNFNENNLSQKQEQFINNLDKWQLQNLKYKIMIVINSLLEFNHDSEVVKRIMRSLPLFTLKNNITAIFKRYKKIYQDQYVKQSLGHAQTDPPKFNSKQQRKYYELITETGFYIYFLISCYIELPSNSSEKNRNINQDLDLQTINELSEIQKDFKESKGSIFDLEQNIIGKFTKFLYAILSWMYQQVKFITQKINIAKSQKQHLDETEAKYFKEGIQFFKRNSASIEIVRNNQIEKVRFIKYPYCHFLPKDIKSQFQENVIRDSIHTKIQTVIDKYKKVIDICKHEEKLSLFFNRNKIVSIFANYVDMWREIAYIITVTLNIFIIISYSELNVDKNKPSNLEPEISSETRWDMRTMNPLLGLTDRYLSVQDTRDLFALFGFIMVFCSMFIMVFFLVKRGPLYLKQAWVSSESFIDKSSGFFIKMLVYIFVIITTILKLLINLEIIYYLSFGLLAILATFVHPFFFAFHLTECFLRYQTLRNVLKSIYDPKIGLILIFILILLFMYFFTVFGYLIFNDSYSNRCDSLYLCFFESFDQNYKYIGGLGGFLNRVKPQDTDNYDYERFLFDNFCYILISIFLSKMFSGLIICTFKQLRDTQMQKHIDVNEMCFICGNSRELFDRKSDKGFQQHIKNDHYIWNYMFYLAYLEERDSTEYTGVESYVKEKLTQLDYTWFPIQRASVLVDDEKKILRDQKELEELQNKLNKYNNQMKEVTILNNIILENCSSQQQNQKQLQKQDIKTANEIK